MGRERSRGKSLADNGVGIILEAIENSGGGPYDQLIEGNTFLDNGASGILGLTDPRDFQTNGLLILNNVFDGNGYQPGSLSTPAERPQTTACI